MRFAQRFGEPLMKDRPYDRSDLCRPHPTPRKTPHPAPIILPCSPPNGSTNLFVSLSPSLLHEVSSVARSALITVIKHPTDLIEQFSKLGICGVIFSRRDHPDGHLASGNGLQISVSRVNFLQIFELFSHDTSRLVFRVLPGKLGNHSKGFVN